ncbi:hypothetical protein [Novosphingobium sp. THN1]|uniref:hypothetical protein n=1 Tax=Novosphingobium sp. THN1 TaxID=1016987 RepID=UPI0013C2D900|nr:hypothetical protein [Novosphingobium sp. THN1]
MGEARINVQDVEQMAACAEVGRNQKHPHLDGWKIKERASGVYRPTLLAQDRSSRIGDVERAL